MSRMTLAAFVLASPAAAGGAPPPTAERAMERYRETFQPTAELDCPRSEGADIVVCGRRSEVDANRLPLPVERVAGEPVRLVPGEPASAAGMASGCVLSCPPAFGVNLDTMRKIANGLGRLIEGDD